MCDVSLSEVFRPHAPATAALIAACAAAGTHRDCARRGRTHRNPDGSVERLCPLMTWAQFLSDAGVQDDHRDLLVADRLGVTPLERDPAAPEDVPLQVVTALLTGQPVTVMHDRDPVRALRLTGRESLVALMGSRGIGKTLAASYLVAHGGGQLVLAYAFARPGLDLAALAAQRGALVIDQLGREYGKSDWTLTQLEEVIELRRRRRRLTVLVANMTREMFAARYDGILDDRLNEQAACVVVYGTSRRGQA